MKPSQVTKIRGQHVCIFGDPKTGKSTLTATALKFPGAKLTWISMDNGHDILFKTGLSMEELDERVNLIILPDTKDNPVAIKTCLKIMTGRAVNICDLHGEVDCATCSSKNNKDTSTWSRVCLDEFTQNDILVFDHLGQLSNSAMTIAYKKTKHPEDDKPEWEHYATQGILLDKFLTNVQQSPCNIVCITHVCEVVMEDDSKKLSPLCGTTNFSRNCGKYFDHMIYCHMRNAGHRFGSMTNYQNNLIAGSRSDVAIEKMKEPSLVPYFDGTILPPESSDTKDAAKVLSSLSQKVTKVSDEPAANLEVLIEKETVTETKTETQSSPVTQTQSPNPIKPTQDRSALLAKLALMNKGNR